VFFYVDILRGESKGVLCPLSIALRTLLLSIYNCLGTLYQVNLADIKGMNRVREINNKRIRCII